VVIKGSEINEVRPTTDLEVPDSNITFVLKVGAFVNASRYCFLMLQQSTCMVFAHNLY